jgi:hypothetical protein
MTRGQFLFVVGLLVVLLAAGGAVYWSQRSDWRSADTRVGQRLVPGLLIADVREIRIQDTQGVVTVEAKDGVWRLRERKDYPANLDRIAEFLDKLAALKVVQVEPLPDSQRARLQLVEPKDEKAKDAGTVVEIKDKAGKTVTRLLLGRKVVRQSATTAPTKGTPDASGRYVAGTEPGVFVVVSDPLTLAEAKPAPWLSRDLIRVHQASRMSSLGPDGKVRWSAARESESADWKSTQGDKLDSNKLQDLVSVLIYVALADVAPDASKAGFENGVTLKIDTFLNYHYALTFGNQEGDLRYMKVALEGDPPPTRKPEKNESAEDKEKKDKQYAEDYKGMLGQIAREKKLEGWTFLVKNEDIQALLRDRAQLQPEKKDDKKKDEKKK